MKKLLVALLTYKTSAHLERALASLTRSEDSYLYDIIVLDNNNAKDETRFKVKDYPILSYFPREINSITGAYNQAIDFFLAKEYEYISFFCADWVYSTGCFPEMIDCLEKNKEYGGATAISNYCATSESFLSESSLEYLRGLNVSLTPQNLIEISDLTGNVLRNSRKGTITESQFFCIGFLCKRQMIEEVGRFNEKINNINDVEYSIRAFKKGWKSIVCHGAFLLHLEMHASWKLRPRQEHITSEADDRREIKNNTIYQPDEKLKSHKFWDSCLSGFYK